MAINYPSLLHMSEAWFFNFFSVIRFFELTLLLFVANPATNPSLQKKKKTVKGQIYNSNYLRPQLSHPATDNLRVIIIGRYLEAIPKCFLEGDKMPPSLL